MIKSDANLKKLLTYQTELLILEMNNLINFAVPAEHSSFA